MELLIAGFVSGVDPENAIVRDSDTGSYYNFTVQQRLENADARYLVSKDLKTVVIPRTEKSNMIRSDFEN